MNEHKRAFTLIELLISIVLLGIIVLSFSSIQVFSTHHLKSSDRRAHVQNEVSFLLDHMTKNISAAIGNENVEGANGVVEIGTFDTYTGIKVFIDANNDGKRDSITDKWIAYGISSTSPLNTVKFCNNYGSTPVWETISGKIQSFDFDASIKGSVDHKLNKSQIRVTVRGCYDPRNSVVTEACGHPNNPEIVMTSEIAMPAVSVN